MGKRKSNTPLPLRFYQRLISDKTGKELYNKVEEGNDPRTFSSMFEISEVMAIDIEKDLMKLRASGPASQDQLKAFQKKMIQQVAYVAQTQAVKGWMLSKQIYRFDPEFWELLTEKGDTRQSVPSEVLLNLPFKCIFLEPLNAFVYLDHSYAEGQYEFKVMQINDKASMCGFVTMVIQEGKTIDECIEATYKETKTMAKKFDPDYQISKSKSTDTDLLLAALQGILYISAVNADIQDEKGKPKEVSESKEEPADRPPVTRKKVTEVKKWQVGETVIRNLKQSHVITESKPRENTSYGWTVRPHIRRAHWHHFWKGPKGKQELIIKWIPPVFVGKESKEIGVTVNKVKGE